MIILGRTFSTFVHTNKNSFLHSLSIWDIQEVLQEKSPEFNPHMRVLTMDEIVNDGDYTSHPTVDSVTIKKETPKSDVLSLVDRN